MRVNKISQIVSKKLTCSEDLADSIVVAEFSLSPADEVSSADTAVRGLRDGHGVGYKMMIDYFVMHYLQLYLPGQLAKHDMSQDVFRVQKRAGKYLLSTILYCKFKNIF